MPALLPTSAAANQIQPCSDPEATPPTKAPILQPKPRRAPQPISNPPIAAAKSEGAGGQLARANGRVPAAAAIAPKIMPRLVRLAVSLRMESDSACFGPGHCQNSARERSAPSRFATLAPQTVNPNVTLQGWPPTTNTAINSRPMATAPTARAGCGATLAPRRRATATTTTATGAMLASVAANPPQGPK